MLMLPAPWRENISTRRSINGVPCTGIKGLGVVIPSLASRDPSPAAIIAKFISIVVVVGLQVQTVAVVALLKIEFLQWETACLLVHVAVAENVNGCIYGLAERTLIGNAFAGNVKCHAVCR